MPCLLAAEVDSKLDLTSLLLLCGFDPVFFSGSKAVYSFEFLILCFALIPYRRFCVVFLQGSARSFLRRSPSICNYCCLSVLKRKPSVLSAPRLRVSMSLKAGLQKPAIWFFFFKKAEGLGGRSPPICEHYYRLFP